MRSRSIKDGNPDGKGKRRARQPLRQTLLPALAVGLIGANALAQQRPAAPLWSQPTEWIDFGDRWPSAGETRPLRRWKTGWIVRSPPNSPARLLLDDLNALTSPGAPFSGVRTRRISDHLWLLNRPADRSAMPTVTSATYPLILGAARKTARFSRVDPLLIEPNSGLAWIPRPRAVIALMDGHDAETELPGVSRLRSFVPGGNQYIAELEDAPAEELLALVHALNEHPAVRWAEADFLSEVRRLTVPDDPLFSQQWHLRNTGQGGGTPGADVAATLAWDRSWGDSQVVIAILDDGVQSSHPDLAGNIAIHPGEVRDGLDNDGNGYVDDVAGWDFYGGDNDPDPYHAVDNHGTSVAGVAAARGNNSLGVSGIAPHVRILPLKLLEGETGFTASSVTAEAIRYAAGLTSPQSWRGADILSLSLSFGEAAAINSAFADAASLGRNGRGCPIFAASGNSASDYVRFTRGEIPAGTWYVEWAFRRFSLPPRGDSAARLAYVRFPDGTVERFDNPTAPAGWNLSPYGQPSWYVENNPARAYGTGRYQMRSGPIGENAVTHLRSPAITLTTEGAVIFRYWISSRFANPLQIRLVNALNGEPTSWQNVDSGVYPTTSATAYPARHPDVMAVGASTDFDYRSDYSQYDEHLDFVAPSSGGFVPILTTDRTGSDGYGGSDYTFDFGGTSSATPLAAGVGALLLSRFPDMTAAEARSTLRSTADKIGGVSYSGGETGAGGFNFFYGYGRLNAAAALGSRLYLDVLSADHGEITTPGTGRFLYPANQTVALAAAPSLYYDFDQWSVTPPASAFLDNPAAKNTSLALLDDTELFAAFAPRITPLGTPEYWLASYGLTQQNNFADEELIDHDGDGQATWREWRAGTDPTSSTSVFAIHAFEIEESGTPLLRWPGVSGRVYQVHGAAHADFTPFEFLASNLAARLPLNTWSGPSPSTNGPIRFFRIGVSLSPDFEP